MVYVYAKQSELNKYIGQKLSVEQIKETLVDLGMDIKGESDDKDPELKIEITSEKLDMVSALGVARAIKFYRGIETQIPKYEIKKSGYSLYVKKSAKDVRPHTACALLRDVPMTEEFLEEMIAVQEKIHDSFGRGRKKAAIGIYPMSKIKFPITFGGEDPKDIVFRPLEADKEMNGHQILELHDTGKKYAHLLDHCNLYPVFRDNDGNVLSMPPIINSHDTGKVDENDRDLFIECSGHNITHLDNVLKVIITTFIEMGARAESIEVSYEGSDEKYELNLNRDYDEIDLEFVNKWIGINLKPEDVTKLLNMVQYDVQSIEGNKIRIAIPPYRSDVWHDVDIADDIARAYGYNNIVPKLPTVASIGSHLPISEFKESFSTALVSLGYLETYTYMLTSTTTQFKKMNLDESQYDFISLLDAADQGLNMVRLMILPESLETLHINRKNKYPQKIFENGFTIHPNEEKDTKTSNESHLCVSIADPKSNYTQIKGVLDTMFKLQEIEFEVRESSESFLIEGRRADIYVKGKKVGFIGEIAPEILINFGLLVPVSTLEVNLENIFELVK